MSSSSAKLSPSQQNTTTKSPRRLNGETVMHHREQQKAIAVSTASTGCYSWSSASTSSSSSVSTTPGVQHHCHHHNHHKSSNDDNLSTESHQNIDDDVTVGSSSFLIHTLSGLDCDQDNINSQRNISNNINSNHWGFVNVENGCDSNAEGIKHSDSLESQSQQFAFTGKAKFRDAQPTLVSKRDFELVHKALTLQQQQSNDFSSGNSDALDSPEGVQTDMASSSASSLASDTASVTSDFIAWLDTPLASAPAAIPPLLTFSKEEKGQPVTVCFYHATDTSKDDASTITDEQYQENDQQGNDQQMFPSTTHDQDIVHQTSLKRSLSSSTTCGGPTSETTPRVPTCKVTLKFSAGVCLLRKRKEGSSVIPEVLVIRRSAENEFYELPKGHLEKGESLVQAAHRELVEETGIKSPIEIGSPLLSERYVVRKSACERLEKSVHYFRARLLCDPENGEVMFGDREVETKELKWIGFEEAKKAFWKSNAVRSVVIMALTDCEI